MNYKHLFILGHPASGSTLLYKFIQTSTHVSGFPKEGQFLDGVKDIIGTLDRWNSEKEIDWDLVKKVWNNNWDLKKEILVEKSPPHLTRAKHIEKCFDNSYFIVLVRNPYAYVEGALRRRNSKIPIEVVARRWIYFANFQRKNLQELKNVLFINYETLTEDTEKVAFDIKNFIPEIGDLNTDKSFKVFDNESKIYNKNPEQIANLSNKDLFRINSVFEEYKHLLKYFGYEIIKTIKEYKFQKRIFSRKQEKYYKKDHKNNLIDVSVKRFLNI